MSLDLCLKNFMCGVILTILNEHSAIIIHMLRFVADYKIKLNGMTAKQFKNISLY